MVRRSVVGGSRSDVHAGKGIARASNVGFDEGV